MEGQEGSSSWPASRLDEEANVFKFDKFYMRQEFCDRTIRLEILPECRGVESSERDGNDIEMGDASASKAAVVAPTDVKESAAGPTQPSEHGSKDGLSPGRAQVEKEPAFKVGEKRRREDGNKQNPVQSYGSSDSALASCRMGPRTGAPEGGEEGNRNIKQPQNATKDGADVAKGLAVDGSSPKRLEVIEAAETAEGDDWVEEIPVSSVVLAAKSGVLCAMLSNGMKESEKGMPVTIKVTPAEKDAFKEMLRFVYCSSLSACFVQPDASVAALVDLLIVGDKFEVGSLLRAVLEVLAAREKSVEDSVVLAMDIPEALEQHPQIKEVVANARAHLVDAFKDAKRWGESLEFLSLREDVVIFLLQSEDLEAGSEEEIFASVLVWVTNHCVGMQERRAAMGRISEHIRFGCMKGDYLVRELLPSPKMALQEVQARVLSGVCFQALSDHEKQVSLDPKCLARKGVREQSFEIHCSFTLDKGGATWRSPQALWLGKAWNIDVFKDKRAAVPTVGIFLTARAPEGVTNFEPIKMGYTFYARTWPYGYWLRLQNEVSSQLFTAKDYSWGFASAFSSLTWEEAKKSALYVGSTGEVTLKVILKKP